MRCGTLICHWHGLALDGGPFAGWSPWPVHDDGTLLWVRLDRAGGETPTERPAVPERPPAGGAVAAVYTGVGTCEPEDVVANRLDPGTAPGSTRTPSSTWRCCGPRPRRTTRWRWRCPSRWPGGSWCPCGPCSPPRAPDGRHADHGGRGAGSVVETHATPLTPAGARRPRTAVVEAVVAGSDRRGFAVARLAAPSSARRCGRRRAACGATTWRTPSGAGRCGHGGCSRAEVRRWGPGLPRTGAAPGPREAVSTLRTPAPPPSAGPTGPAGAPSTASGPAGPSATGARWPPGSPSWRPVPSAPPAGRCGPGRRRR